MIQFREYKTGSEVLAGAAAVRKRLMSLQGSPREFTEPQMRVRIVYSRPKRQWTQHQDEHVKDRREHLKVSRERPEAFLKRRCAEMGASFKDVVKSNSRFKEHVEPRQILMAELRTRYGMSFPAIGKLFGGRDHTTAVHACRKNGIKSRGRHLVSDHHDAVKDMHDRGLSDYTIGETLGFTHVAIWTYRRKHGWSSR